MNQKSFTDVVLQQVKVYIEGVQVPFNSVSITSGIGGLPSATITVPAQAGLMDIARFYSPKVHIFFSDRNFEYDQSDPTERKLQDKLLFSGLIAQVAYVKSKNIGANVMISFNCIHRYNLISDMLIDYSGWMNRDPLNITDNDGATKADTANSPAAIIEAMAGITSKTLDSGPPETQEITENNPQGKTSIMPKRYEQYFNRVLGMPSILYNFWNQMKRSAFNRKLRQGDKFYSEPFVKMHKPLMEDGLQFFDRIAGHYPIEALAQDDMYRADPCPETPNRKEKILVAPTMQLFLPSAVQADMSVSNVASYLQNSGEVTSIYNIFSQFYESIDYELVTLASPAEVALHPDPGEVTSKVTFPIDTIVKPKIPFYFSPTCNVLFPGMYHNVNVTYDEINIPTRVKLKNLEGPGTDGFRTNFMAPHSIREAIAKKVTTYFDGRKYSLLSTTGNSYGAIGLYEQGRGIKQESMVIPRWLSLYSQSSFGSQGGNTDQGPDKVKEPGKYEALTKLAAGWAKRYPGDPVKSLNPYTTEDSTISAHHRILFTSADYYYTQVFARSKGGSVECPFNPFIVPGYPMDILEANPTYPSFHAMCTSVTHTISAEQIGTTVQFVGAMTYSELANYYVPFISPMLQVALKLAENPTLVGFPEGHEALATADEFYRYTLGVPCAAPDILIDFNTMVIKPKKWNDTMDAWVEGSEDILRGPNGGDYNPMNTMEGNMSMVYREIESRLDVEDRFDLKFIDMDPANYNSSVVRYENKELEDSQKYEIGRSQFLRYDTFFGEAIKKETPAAGSLVTTPAPVEQTSDTTTGKTTTTRQGQ